MRTQQSRYEYPEYKTIAKHIRSARIERVVPTAEAIADFLVWCWNELQAPPAPAPMIVERRRDARGVEHRVIFLPVSP
jgi:hypothetical protein